MSVLRSCQRALPARATGISLASVRSLATDSATPAAKPTEQKQIEHAPQQDILAADLVSGAPTELRHRAVRIFQYTRSTTQSGHSKSQRWRIDWDILPGGGRWENPLMGWASSADYMQGTRLGFRTKEDAIHFAEKQGWDYYVQQPEIKVRHPKNYSENFLYKPNQLRLIRTK
ncbi:NADH-ubiquinone oxidoreductase 21kDa subunit [Fomitopsis betulina]|nr:NADH-ubiquinone oxidoreductase 21kDa subunit [Fomitopsis betulina]